METIFIQDCSLPVKVLSLCVSLYAGSLSWNCNADLPLIPRSIYALFAFSFGLTYIILYIIFRLNDCRSRHSL
jgi:hypothetical protein